MFTRMLLFLALGLVKGQNSEQFSNDDFTVEVKINAKQPRYTFWNNNDPAEKKYRVFFSKIYETKNGNKAEGSNIALASINWVIQEDTQSESGNVAFWINGTTRTNGNSGGRFSVISFRNEILSEAFKFDVYLEEYDWKDLQSDTLDLEWKLTNSTESDDQDDGLDEEGEPVLCRRSLRDMWRSLQDEEQPPASQEEDRICFFGDRGDSENQVCWKVEEEAVALQADGTNTTVPVELDLDGGFIKVKYQNWGEGNLLHDPTVRNLLGTTFGNSCFFLDIFCWFLLFVDWVFSLFQ